MAYIGPLPAETFTSFATQEFSTSATTSYTLDHPVTNENELALFINNVRQQPGSGKAYTASGTALTLSAATASTDTMYAVFLGRALQTVNPADASVGTSQLAATSVTAAKLNNDIISGTTALAEAPADTDEFLVSDAGTLKRIDYSYIKGGGMYEHITTTQLSGSSVASVSFTSTHMTTTYIDYLVVISGLSPATNGNNSILEMTISSNGGSSYLTASNYFYGGHGEGADGTLRTRESNADDSFRLNVGGIGEDSTGSFMIEMFDPLNQTSDRKYFQMIYRAVTRDGNAGEVNHTSGSAMYKDGLTTPFNAVKFNMGTGDLDTGYFSLYGRKVS